MQKGRALPGNQETGASSLEGAPHPSSLAGAHSELSRTLYWNKGSLWQTRWMGRKKRLCLTSMVPCPRHTRGWKNRPLKFGSSEDVPHGQSHRSGVLFLSRTAASLCCAPVRIGKIRKTPPSVLMVRQADDGSCLIPGLVSGTHLEF